MGDDDGVDDVMMIMIIHVDIQEPGFGILYENMEDKSRNSILFPQELDLVHTGLNTLQAMGLG